MDKESDESSVVFQTSEYEKDTENRPTDDDGEIGVITCVSNEIHTDREDDDHSPTTIKEEERETQSATIALSKVDNEPRDEEIESSKPAIPQRRRKIESIYTSLVVEELDETTTTDLSERFPKRANRNAGFTEGDCHLCYLYDGLCIRKDVSTKIVCFSCLNATFSGSREPNNDDSIEPTQEDKIQPQQSQKQYTPSRKNKVLRIGWCESLGNRVKDMWIDCVPELECFLCKTERTLYVKLELCTNHTSSSFASTTRNHGENVSSGNRI